MDILNSNLYQLMIDDNYFKIDSFLFKNTILKFSSYSPKDLEYLQRRIKDFILYKNFKIYEFFYFYNLDHINGYIFIDGGLDLRYLYEVLHEKKITSWNLYVSYYTYQRLAKSISLDKQDNYNITLIMEVMQILFKKYKLKKFYQLIQNHEFDMSIKNDSEKDLLSLVLQEEFDPKDDLIDNKLKNLKILYQDIINYLLTLPNINPNKIFSGDTLLDILCDFNRYSYLSLIVDDASQIYNDKNFNFADQILIKLVKDHGYRLNRKVGKNKVERALSYYKADANYSLIISLGGKLEPVMIANLNNKYYNINKILVRKNLIMIFKYFMKLIKNGKMNINQFYNSQYGGGVNLPMMAAYIGIEDILDEIFQYNDNYRISNGRNVINFDLKNTKGQNMLYFANTEQNGKNNARIVAMILNRR